MAKNQWRKHRLDVCVYCGRPFLHRADKKQECCGHSCAKLLAQRKEPESEPSFADRLAEGFRMLGQEE